MKCAVAVALCVVGCGRWHFDPLGDDDGDGGLGDGREPDVAISNNLVFVSQPSFVLGAIGTLQAADAMCQAEADQAGIAGTYVAWLSTSSMSAVDRLASARGWVRPDGVPIADLPSDLVTRKIRAPANLDADGTQLPASNPLIATGTLENGAVGMNCSNFVDTAGSITHGDLTAVGGAFTSYVSSSDCDVARRVYCFATDLVTPLVVPPVVGRRAFLSTPWAPGGGLASADQHCNNDATAAGIGGMYRALLATSGGSAASRFMDGPPWVRVDGVALTPTAAHLLTSYMHIPLNVDANGTYHGDGGQPIVVWLGAFDPPDPQNSSCLDWTSTANNRNGTTNFADFAPDTSVGSLGCDRTARLYCLEP